MSSETSAAAQLVAYGLRPKTRPADEPEYRDLIRRYRQEDSFASAVRDIAGGMGLDVLDVTEPAGAVLGARDGSVFAARMGDYYARAREGQARNRVLHGLAQLAIAANCYPRPADLDDPEHAPRVAVNEVDEYVRDLCRRLDEQHQDEELDPPVDEPGLERAWRMYRHQPEVATTEDGRASASATRQVIVKAFEALTEQGLMRKVSDQLGGTYQPTPAYRVHVLEVSREDYWFELDQVTRDTEQPRW